jgi:plasmid stabilization system protein ParE
MAYKIVWSDEAQNDFKNVIFYLQDNWSVQSAEKFVSHTFKIVEQLAEVPSRARPTSKENIFLYKLDKKNVLFFSLESKNVLLILSIYPYQKDITRSKYY